MARAPQSFTSIPLWHYLVLLWSVCTQYLLLQWIPFQTLRIHILSNMTMIINISCQPRSQYCEFIKVSLMSKLNNYNIIGVCCPVITFNFRDLHQMVIEKLHLAPGGGGHSTGGCWSQLCTGGCGHCGNTGQLLPAIVPNIATCHLWSTTCRSHRSGEWKLLFVWDAVSMTTSPGSPPSHRHQSLLPMATVSLCPAGRWRMLSLTRFMKTAAPDQAADLTRYTLVQ